MSEPYIRAREVLSRLNGVAPTGVEVGVAIGQMSQALLEGRGDLKLYMVDSWAGPDSHPEAYKASGDWHAHATVAEQQAHYEHALKATDFAADRRVVMREASAEAAQKLKDKSLSFVFIDADHSYDGCSADIEAWRGKVKPGGWLCGHDYGFELLPGVKKAVDDAVRKHKWKLERGENYTWFVRIA
jgi:predicted DCC family thiol-disulfide oxidoreductase YuxK